MPISAPAGAKAASLNGIACPTTSACTSVGDVQVGNSVQALAEAWNGKAWRIEPFAPSAAHAAALTAVSCPLTAQCFAVGSRQRSAKSKPEALIERWTGRS
jgi:hypothetical protein